MHAALGRQKELFPSPVTASPLPPPLAAWPPAPQPEALPRHGETGAQPLAGPRRWAPEIDAALWRGDQLGQAAAEVQPTGFAALDRELPGGGWPSRGLTELLQPQPGALEWRLLGPALRTAAVAGRGIVLVSPPWRPHLPGLRQVGLDERQLVWVQAETVAERLWCTEQLVKANAFGALVAWLPQARPEQIRRLQVCALASEGLVFLCRPIAAQHESSAAPLRLLARPRPDWLLELRLLKRRGPALDEPLLLPAVPGRLQAVLTPRTERPSRLLPPVRPPSAAPAPAVQVPEPLAPGGFHAVMESSPPAPRGLGSAILTPGDTAVRALPEGAADAVGSTAPATRPRRYAPLR